MRDIQEGCQPVVEQLNRWTNALMTGDFDQLEHILASDFQFTVDPRFAGGRMDKARFIELDRKIKRCTIDLMEITARRMGTIVTTLILAQVSEEFSGDLGEDMPSNEEMAAAMAGAKLAYASAWRSDDGSQWQCFSHHVFGFVAG